MLSFHLEKVPLFLRNLHLNTHIATISNAVEHLSVVASAKFPGDWTQRDVEEEQKDL